MTQQSHYWACKHAQSLTHVWLFATPWTVTCQAPLSVGFSRQEYWSGLPLPSPTIGHTPEKTITEKDTHTPIFIAALFTIARTWKQSRGPSIDEWIKQLWYIYIYIYTQRSNSHKKEHIWVSSNEVDEPTAYYTEWSKSGRERQTSCINAYIWNLER